MKLVKVKQSFYTICENYLFEIESDNKHYMTPNIDGILNVIDTLDI